MSAINELGEAIALLLEPSTTAPATVDGVRTVTADSGAIVDLNMARPFEWKPGMLYAWPTRHDHALAGAGNPPEEQENFAFQFVYCADRLGEEPQLQARRDVSDALDAKAAAYAAAVAANRSKYADGTPAPWDLLTSSINHDTTHTFGVRGVAAVVSGYRIVRYP